MNASGSTPEAVYIRSDRIFVSGYYIHLSSERLPGVYSAVDIRAYSHQITLLLGFIGVLSSDLQ